jgi:hypothetical protein
LARVVPIALVNNIYNLRHPISDPKGRKGKKRLCNLFRPDR